MNMSLKIGTESGFLHVVVSGEFSLEKAKRSFLEVREVVGRQRTNKVLIDGRQLTGEPTIMERFFYAEFSALQVASLRAEGVPHVARFAYLLEEPVLDPNRFGETVAVNRGMLVKAFDNLEEAIVWLG